MKRFATLISKELLLERRTMETVSAFGLLSLTLVLMIALGVESLVVPQQTVERFFSLHCWIIFLVSSSVVLGRSLDRDREWGALSGLMLCGVTAQEIFLSKLLMTTIICWSGHLITVALLALFENVSLTDRWLHLSIISLLVSTAFSSLATLLVALTASSRLKSLLLPLILLPLIFPLFFAAHELYLSLFLVGPGATFGAWYPFLGLLTIIYVAVSFCLYGRALRG